MAASELPARAWYAVAHQADLSVPTAVRLHELPVVLVPGSPDVAAWVDRCPHRHAPLSQGSVRGGALTCPYHGWQFDQNGRCTHIPGLDAGEPDQRARRLSPVPVRVVDGVVWLAPDADVPGEPLSLPIVGEAGVRTLRWCFRVDAPAVDAIENFLDPMHTHFVHSGLVRTEGRRRAVPVTVRGFDGGVEAVYRETQQSGRIAQLFGADIVESYGRYVWPGVAQLGYRDGAGVEKMQITAAFRPTPDGVAITAVVAGRAPWWLPGWLAGWLIAPPFKRTVHQDRQMLEMVARHDGGPRPPYAMSPTDLLRPHIDRLLADPTRLTPSQPRELTVRL